MKNICAESGRVGFWREDVGLPAERLEKENVNVAATRPMEQELARQVGRCAVKNGVAHFVSTYSPVPLSTYDYDSELARDEKIIITVKTTLQLHRNIRQEEQQKRPRSDIFGRERPRRYVNGFVAGFSLSHNRLDWDLAQSEWAFSALEPYAVDVCANRMAFAGANYVKLIDLDNGHEMPLRHPWLRQVHSVQFSSDGQKLLVASTGFDAVMEFDTYDGQVTWEWFAWDHGFDRSLLGHHVVRFSEKKQLLATAGEEVLLVENPSLFEVGVATRLIPAHLNSARYDSDGKILATLFHQGTGIIIDRLTGEAREVVSGLINPHKLSKRQEGGYCISDTRRGQLVFVDENYQRVSEISVAGLPGVERSHLLSEFLQNTTNLGTDLYASIDIHRNSIWIIDVKREKYRGIKFPREWSVHDIASVDQTQMYQIGQLVGTTFGRVVAFFDDQAKVIRHFSVEGQEIERLNIDAQGLAVGLNVEM